MTQFPPTEERWILCQSVIRSYYLWEVLPSQMSGSDWTGRLVFLTVFVWVSWCESRLWREAREGSVKKEEGLRDLVVNHN